MDELKETLQSVIDQDRIGSPVFIRVVLNMAENVDTLIHPTSELVAFSNALIPSEIRSLYTQSSNDDTQVTVMLHFVGGQMALLSTNRVDSQTDIDLMLVGNKGVIYHQTPIGRNYLSGNPPILGETGLFTDVMTQSLATGKPIKVEA
ncbi:hypothetical protein C6497_08880 [Candidatus Poribacteria bacterium]|nr:MAG: hypothetical protein C6497_08880 [Candidatus Poribacteria bacterium]